MLENVQTATVETLVKDVERLRDEGYRFLTASCVDLGENFEIIYHFDRDLEGCNLRLTFGRAETVPSISGVFLCSVIIENEMKELFGCKIENIAIDYKGMLYSTAEGLPLPMVKQMKVVVSNN